MTHDPTPRDRIEPRPTGRVSPLASPLAPALGLVLGLVLSLALLVPLGCGGDRSEEAGSQQAAATSPEDPPTAGQATDGSAIDSQTGAETPAPAETAGATEETGADGAAEAAPSTDEGASRPAERTEPDEQERADLARKQKELDAREARLDRREAALRQSTAPTAAPAPQPTTTDPATDDMASPPAADTGGSDDWRRSTHRADRAAREGYEPAPPSDGETDGGMAAGEDAWPEEAGAAQPSATEQEPQVTWTSEELPSGTRFTVELLDTVASDRNRPGDTFRARVVDDVTRGGDVVIPAGSIVRGRVTEAVPLERKVGGRARLGLEFYEIEPPGAQPAPIDADFAAKGKSETAKDAATIGGAAAAGAILGRVLNRGDKGKGSVLGAIVGAAAGTAIAAHNEGQEVELPQGAQVELVLTQPAEVPVREP